MGFLDKVKEKAAVALEQGKDVAQQQQLKMQLKKLEGEEEQALAAFGNAAFTITPDCPATPSGCTEIATNSRPTRAPATGTPATGTPATGTSATGT